MAKVTVLPTPDERKRFKPFTPFTLTIETGAEANSLWHRLNAEKAIFTDYANRRRDPVLVLEEVGGAYSR